jgi:hypothetical protein
VPNEAGVSSLQGYLWGPLIVVPVDTRQRVRQAFRESQTVDTDLRELAIDYAQWIHKRQLWTLLGSVVLLVAAVVELVIVGSWVVLIAPIGLIGGSTRWLMKARVFMRRNAVTPAGSTG